MKRTGLTKEVYWRDDHDDSCRLRDVAVPLLRNVQNLGEGLRMFDKLQLVVATHHQNDKLKFVGHRRASRQGSEHCMPDTR